MEPVVTPVAHHHRVMLHHVVSSLTDAVDLFVLFIDVLVLAFLV